MTSQTTEPAGLPTFHPKSKTLTFWTKDRGIGDCGSLVTYAFPGDRAEVVEARAQACCDDEKKFVIDPNKWAKVRLP